MKRGLGKSRGNSQQFTDIYIGHVHGSFQVEFMADTWTLTSGSCGNKLNDTWKLEAGLLGYHRYCISAYMHI